MALGTPEKLGQNGDQRTVTMAHGLTFLKGSKTSENAASNPIGEFKQEKKRKEKRKKERKKERKKRIEKKNSEQ